MALYVCQGIEDGSLDYLLLFSNPHNAKIKPDVDGMLVVDGKQALIVVIPV